MYNLFLDDARIPEDAYYYTFNSVYLKNKWIEVVNYDEFVKYVTENGVPHMVSFDHDLGDNYEDWKDVVGFEGIYIVSTYGQVKRVKKCRGTIGNNILSLIKRPSGLYVTLRDINRNVHKLVHRLVGEAFLKNDNNYSQINHIDGNRWNNNVDNIEWCSQSDNIKHSHRVLGRDYSSYGENHGNSISVSQYNKNGDIVNVYGSVNEAGRQLKIPFTNIAKCSRNERKSAGGFVWKYENKIPTVNTVVEHIKNKNYCENFFIPDHKEKTGFHCAKWLIEYCVDNKLMLPSTILIHSANSVGRDNIKSLFDTYNKYFRDASK